MQLRYALTALLYALCCAEGVSGEAVLRKRQDNTDVATSAPSESTPASSATSTTAPPPSSTAEPSPTSETTEPVSTSNDQSSTTSPTTSSTTQDATSTTTGGAAKATQTADKAPQLPIQPVITPALGIAGVILMGTGIAFCLIGIKHQWLHVYLSAAFATSLAVTVLVVYIMNPPISDAIQGAYFVAAVVTGLIFGALSLVFKDITEGLGCLVGGFCLAMWLMVLRPGGLVQTDTGRAVMIGVFCVVGLSLSFSQYTRNYGLIGCTAFAGAMITVLGIDCFSRAGLKEFWLYVWNLNNDIFPIGTHTYPITRGIRVEIAVTIIIFLFGLMSQLKIWKIVKERREKKEAQRLAEDESRDQLAGEVGQDVEALNKRQRDQWEALYGDGKKAQLHQDSGVGTSVGSTHKKSTSVTTRELDTIELDENPRTIRQSGSKLPNVSTRNTTEEDLSNVEGGYGRGLAESADWSSHAGSRRSTTSYKYTDIDESMPTQQPGGPQVVPLPFSPPAEPDSVAKSDAGSAKSAGTAFTALNPLALKQHNERVLSRLPRIEDDRASSIAATADDEPEVDGDSFNRKAIVRPSYRMKSTPTPDVDESARPSYGLLAGDEKTRDRSRTPSGQRTPQEPAVEDEDDEELVRPPTALDEVDVPSSTKQPKRESISSRRRSVGSGKSADVDEDNVSNVGSLTGHLPEAISKVAMAYRTNEWAKHIADADQPDEIAQEPDSPGIQVDTAFREEAARPVDTKALSEAPVVTPAEVPRSKPSRRESKNPHRQSSGGKAPSVRRSTSGGTPVYAFQRSSSQQSMMRQSSNEQLRREQRGTMSPMEQPLMESPIEENAEYFVTPMTSSNNLLDQRNDRLKRKTTTTNFNALNMGVAEESPATRPGEASSPIGESSQIPAEDMTLAQRKVLIQQGQLSPSSPTAGPAAPSPIPEGKYRRTSNHPPSVNRKHSTSNPHLIYDSHQPKRSNTVDTQKQNTMYSQWRSSLAQDSGANKAPQGYSEEQARQQMISQREAAAHDQMQRQQKRAQRESRMDMAARSGRLHNAHQSVLSKMQAKANEANQSAK